MKIGKLEIKYHKSEYYFITNSKKVRKIITEAKKEAFNNFYYVLNEDNSIHILWKVPAIKKCVDLFGWDLGKAKYIVEQIEKTMPKFIINSLINKEDKTKFVMIYKGDHKTGNLITQYVCMNATTLTWTVKPNKESDSLEFTFYIANEEKRKQINCLYNDLYIQFIKINDI